MAPRGCRLTRQLSAGVRTSSLQTPQKCPLGGLPPGAPGAQHPAVFLSLPDLNRMVEPTGVSRVPSTGRLNPQRSRGLYGFQDSEGGV
jgi:hypothetical protein